jgi:TctA family transporter
MESWQTAVVVLLAVLVGATVPALASVAGALRAARRAMDRTGAQLSEALVAVTGAVERIDRLASRLEEGKRIETLVESVTALSQTVNRFRDTVKVASAVGAAVGPAVGAAVRAWRETRHDGGAGPDGHGEPQSKGEREEVEP